VTDTYKQCGVYQLKCGECPLMYVGQKERIFKDRCREHIQPIRNNGETSNFAQYTRMLETGHTYGTMEETIEILQINKKGHLLNTLEHFHIYNLSNKKLQIPLQIYEYTTPYATY
jgi:hypothetical protein